MDTEGDFVITWQSNGNIAAGANEDDSGYGVYAQRFSPGGVKIGGVNCMQTLTFSGPFCLRQLHAPHGRTPPATCTGAGHPLRQHPLQIGRQTSWTA